MIVFEAKGEAVAARPKIAALPANPRLPEEIGLERAKRVDLTISGGGASPFAIDGTAFVDWTPKPSFAVPRGSPVTLGVVNKTADPDDAPGAMSGACCTRSTTAGSPIGATFSRRAGQDHPRRLRRRQSRQMADQIGDPRAPHCGSLRLGFRWDEGSRGRGGPGERRPGGIFPRIDCFQGFASRKSFPSILPRVPTRAIQKNTYTNMFI